MGLKLNVNTPKYPFLDEIADNDDDDMIKASFCSGHGIIVLEASQFQHKSSVMWHIYFKWVMHWAIWQSSGFFPIPLTLWMSSHNKNEVYQESWVMTISRKMRKSGPMWHRLCQEIQHQLPHLHMYYTYLAPRLFCVFTKVV